MNKRNNNSLISGEISWDEFWQEITCSRENNKPITGFKNLDGMLGGIESGSIITIGGRPAMGKTTLLMTILENALKLGHKCLYFALNTSEKEFKKRLFMQYAELDNIKVKEGEISELEKEQLAKVFNSFKKFNVQLNCDWMVNINDIEEKIFEYKPDYVFIDYFQVIDLELNKEIPTNKEISLGFEKVLKRIKYLAREFDCYVFIASQLSRAIESRVDKRPLISDLRETKALAKISDVVIFLYRDEYYNRFDESPKCSNIGVADLIVAKNMFGVEATAKLKFNKKIPKFYDKASGI